MAKRRNVKPAGKPRRSPMLVVEKVLVTTVFAIIITISTVVLAAILAVKLRDLSNFRVGNDSLKKKSESLKPEPEIKQETKSTQNDTPEPTPQYVSAFDTEMREINPDYMCWIKIEDTIIDYPVVRGDDNERYLNTSFYNEKNELGALFMDYRCAGESTPHIIIYGHNARSGDLFGSLRRFLDESYLADHPKISLKINDSIVEYEIFSARKTDVADIAYNNLNFGEYTAFCDFAEKCGAPSGAEQILTLSTCVSAGNNNERVIVQGVLCN
jgi:sortase B